MTRTLGEVGALIEPLTPALTLVASAIDLTGIAIVLWGFLLALFGFLRSEVRRFREGAGTGSMRQLRIDFGTYILVGIEFMIASDMIRTVVTRQLIDLAFVSALVAIRAAISFFLSREITEVRKEEGTPE